MRRRPASQKEDVAGAKAPSAEAALALCGARGTNPAPANNAGEGMTDSDPASDADLASERDALESSIESTSIAGDVADENGRGSCSRLYDTYFHPSQPSC